MNFDPHLSPPLHPGLPGTNVIPNSLPHAINLIDYSPNIFLCEIFQISL